MNKDDLTKLEKALCANDSHSFFDGTTHQNISQHLMLQPVTTTGSSTNISTVITLATDNGIENVDTEHGNETDENELTTEEWRENVSKNE